MTEQELLGLRDKSFNIDKYLNPSDDFLSALIFNSLSFENNYGTIEDVKRVLSGSQIESTKFQALVLNLKKSYLEVLRMIKEGVDLTEEKLKDLHQMVMGDDALGGLYRNVDISIKGSNHTPPSYIKVYDRMKKYFDYLKDSSPSLEVVSYSHLQLAKIHPFLDGNGRLARLVLDYNLLKYNLPPVVISYDKKDEYFNCLEEFKVNKNINAFIEFLIKLISEELK